MSPVEEALISRAASIIDRSVKRGRWLPWRKNLLWEDEADELQAIAKRLRVLREMSRYLESHNGSGRIA